MRKGIALVVVAVAAIVFFSTTSSSQGTSETFRVDGAHSNLIFRITHLNVSAFYGRFNRIEGSFTVAEGGTGSVDITIDAASVDTANADRDKHLKSPDFFSVKQFPKITFKGDLKHVSGSKYEVTGTLDLHGTKKPIKVDLERLGTAKAMGGNRTGFEGTFTIKRTDFGMTWRTDLLGDEVKCIVAFEGLNPDE